MVQTVPPAPAPARPANFAPAPAALDVAWQRSRRTYAELERRFANGPGDPRVVTAYFVGSLGRMEQVAGSDADLIVIVEDGVDLESPTATEARDSIWRELVPVGLPRPKPSGIYAQVDTCERLRDPSTRGVINEDMGVFGRRFQLLLEGQPACRADAYCQLRDALVVRYLASPDGRQAHVGCEYLLHDLIRYYRSLCVRTQWISEPGSWRLINAKLRHSRRVSYAGLLLLLGAFSDRGRSDWQWLASRLNWTPLERIAAVFAMYGDDGFGRIAEAYARFLVALNDEAFRAALADNAIPDRETPEHRELRRNSEEITGPLLEFCWQRRGDWPREFFEALLF